MQVKDYAIVVKINDESAHIVDLRILHNFEYNCDKYIRYQCYLKFGNAEIGCVDWIQKEGSNHYRYNIDVGWYDDDTYEEIFGDTDILDPKTELKKRFEGYIPEIELEFKKRLSCI